MFTAAASIAIVFLAWTSSRWDNKERERPANLHGEDEIRQAIVFTRQDVRLIAFLLAGILVALGVIADRLP
jgi:hypothetical protein